MKLRIERKKYAVDSEIEFPKKSILRTMIITETTRQLESSNFDFFESKNRKSVNCNYWPEFVRVLSRPSSELVKFFN